MNNKLNVNMSKSLRLDNVLIKQIIETIDIQNNSDKEILQDDFFETIVVQMENQIINKGANVIGPLIQYSGIDSSNEEMNITMAFMLQSNKYINNIDPGFKMKSVIKVPNCLYVRFKGKEEDLQIAYQKIRVEAYENNIMLKGSSYTIYVDANEDGDIVADIFMEKEGVS